VTYVLPDFDAGIQAYPPIVPCGGLARLYSDSDASYNAIGGLGGCSRTVRIPSMRAALSIPPIHTIL